jgi:hypothetical protein
MYQRIIYYQSEPDIKEGNLSLSLCNTLMDDSDEKTIPINSDYMYVMYVPVTRIIQVTIKIGSAGD